MNKKMRRMIKERRKRILHPVKKKLSRNKSLIHKFEPYRILLLNAEKKWDLNKIHKLSMRNVNAVLKSEEVACFYCGRVFPPSDFEDCNLIEEYEGGPDSRTAWCPHCGIDSIIAESDEYEITEELIMAMGYKCFNLYAEMFPD